MLAMTAMVQAQTPDFVFDEVTYTPEKTTFKLFAPRDAKSVKVEYDVNPNTAAVSKWKAVKMKIGKDGIWQAVVKRDLNHHEYRFYVDGQYSPGVFAKAVGVNGQLGCVLDLSETNPEGWTYDRRPEVKSPTDLVIYEMHHRDFSIDPSAGITPQHRGKFLALTEPKAIEHLKSLGVNAIHILPSYDFGSIDETRLQDKKYNWVYDTVNYNVPEGSYSTNPYDPACRIREF